MERVRQRRPPAFRFAEAIVRPIMAATTRQRWSGAEHLPEHGGFIVAPNHLSHIDPLVIAHFLVDQGYTPHFLGKIEVFNTPVVGSILRAAEQIPVHRGSGQAAGAYRAAVAAVEAGRCVVVYPEGTLTRDPQMWPMRGKTGAARIALQTGCPVVPVAHWGAQQILAPYSHRPHLVGRKVMAVRAGPAVDLAAFVGRAGTHEVLERATESIMTALTAQLEVLRGESAPPVRHDPRTRREPRPDPSPKETS